VRHLGGRPDSAPTLGLPVDDFSFLFVDLDESRASKIVAVGRGSGAVALIAPAWFCAVAGNWCRMPVLASWRRKVKRLGLGLLGLVVLVLVVALLALAYLDVRPMKGWIRGAAQGQGIALDFDRARVTIGGVRLRNVRVASPAADAALAPQLITVGSIDGSWSPFSKRLDDLVIRDVTITIVRNPDGTTSLDRFLAGMPPQPEPPPQPLSQLARALVPEGIEAHARVEGVKVIVIDRVTQAETRTATLTGLTAAADLADAKLKLRFGGDAVKLVVVGLPPLPPLPDAAPQLAAGPREVALQLRGDLELAARGHGRVALEAALQKQTLARALPPVKQLLGLTATLDFLPGEKRTRVQVEKLSLLDGAAQLTAKAVLEDLPAPHVGGLRPLLEEGALRVDLVALARAVPPELGPLEVEGEPLVATVKQAALAPAPQGSMTASGKLVRLRWRDLEVRGLGLEVAASPISDAATPSSDPLSAGLRAELKVPIEQVSVPGLTLTGVEARLLAVRPPSSAPAVAASAAPDVTVAADPLRQLWPLEVTGAIKVASVTTPTQHARALAVETHATVRSADVDATFTATLESLGGAASLQGLRVEATAKLAPGATPLDTTGDIAAHGTIASLRDATGKRAKDVRWRGGAQLRGGAPARASFALDATTFVLPGLAQSLGPAFGGGPLHAEVEVSQITIDPSDPAKSRGEAHLSASYGRATVDATIAGSMAQVTWKGKAAVPRVVMAAAPAAAATRPTQTTRPTQLSGIAITSTGHATPGAAGSGRGLRFDHDTAIELGSVTASGAAMRGVHLRAAGSGSATHYDGKLDAALASITSAGKSLGGSKLQLATKLDLTRPSVELHLTGAQPATDLRLLASVGPRSAGHAVRWQARGTVGNLAALAALLPPGPDWRRLAIDVDGSGTATGVITGVRGGVPVLALDPAATARGVQKLALTVRELHYRDLELTSADIAAMTIETELSLGETRAAILDIAVPQLAAVSRGVKLGAEALALRLEASFAHRRGGPPMAGELAVKLTVRARSARQTVLPWYALAAPELSLTVSGDVTQKLVLAMQLANPGAGTKVELAGDLERDLGDPAAGVLGRSSLALHGTLEQKLDSLNAAPEKLRARGHLAMPFQIESGDLSLFRTTAKLTLRDVSIELPARKLRIAQVRGELPVTQEIVITQAGPERVGQGERGLFSQLRFPDYRPFAGSGDYLSIGELTYAGKSYGPVAGNARIDRDIVAVDQLELTALGGKITGQCLAELRGVDTQLAFRGKLTGIQPSVPALLPSSEGGQAAPSTDKLDANTAIVITPYRYGLEGRMEIVRIGRAHLLALLDLWDPFRADVAANRVRLALKVGYPEQVRLHFSRGFASLAIDLGGLAGVVRIDEIRGIPIGPALAHWLAPILEQP
jgi:hypothetical protein